MGNSAFEHNTYPASDSIEITGVSLESRLSRVAWWARLDTTPADLLSALPFAIKITVDMILTA